ncbi:hypothetical protein SBRCBS47491_009000 [Sporothrix bragantina]|uniref:Ankyrin repeat protein n=1 Tax=Sporothrix bragantina TaxID=671064 RepID=A0ABP0CUF0_9PEZI
MDSELPAYSPPAAGTAVPPPQAILYNASSLPPSYDVATAGDANNNRLSRQSTAQDNDTTSINDILRRESSPTVPRSFQNNLSVLSSRSSGKSSHARSPPAPAPALALPSAAVPVATSPPTSSSFVNRLSALKLKNKEKNVAIPVTQLNREQVHKLLGSIFRQHPWKRTWGPWPPTLDVALRTAALHGDVGLVRALLDAGAPILYTDRFAAIKSREGSVLHAALRGGAPELAEEIVGVFWARLLSTRDTSSPNDYPDIEDACKRTAALIDSRDGKGCAPLHIAAEAGATGAVIQLLQRGAEVDAVDDWGRTPLHMAARYGRREAAEILVAAGADMEHLLPPPFAQDAKDVKSSKAGLVPMWADAMRRGSAGAERLAALGDHRVVTELVGSIAADVATARAYAGDVKEQPQTQTQTQTTAWSNTSVQVPSSSSSSSSRGTDLFRHGTARPKIAPIFHAPDPFSIPSDASSLMAQQRMLHPWRRPQIPRTMGLTGTPAYEAWRDGLDRLHTEHREQKERNERADIPDGMDL